MENSFLFIQNIFTKSMLHFLQKLLSRVTQKHCNSQQVIRPLWDTILDTIADLTHRRIVKD